MILPRMTTRRWMFAVAVGAAVLGAGIASQRRSSRLASIARSHGERAFLLAVADDDARFSRNQALYDYHVGLMRKYARVARYAWLPFLPVPPDRTSSE